MKRKEKWDFIKQMQYNGYSDEEIARMLKYKNVQSLWNWISRNKDKYENEENPGLLDKLIGILSGQDKEGYLFGLFMGYLFRNALDNGLEALNKETITLYETIWFSFLTKGGLKRGLLQGLAIKDIPALGNDLQSFYEGLLRYYNNQ
ncbi:MAG: hypothetical protein HeimC2_28320 [Candidatus Heimdallarchaeota archaeon LC_2]|nr:MAG: hypothetical protein HeimC2_28320 [Candidatus Heimdallarchaeota archaeon LC_2]